MKKQRLQSADVAWLAAVGLLVLLQFWWLPGDRRAAGDSYSTAIEGKRGFYDTLIRLSEAGVLPDVYRETGKLAPDSRCTLLLIGPDRYPTPAEIESLNKFVRAGGSLVFSPNWLLPDFNARQLEIRLTKVPTDIFPTNSTVVSGNVPASNSAEESAAEPTLESIEAETDLSESDDSDANPSLPGSAVEEIVDGTEDDFFDSLEVPALPTVSRLFDGTLNWRSRSHLTPPFRSTDLLESNAGDVHVAAWKIGRGQVVVLDSSDVFSNRSMLDDAQAVAAIRFIEYARQNQRPQAPIIVSEYLNATKSFQNVGVLMSPSLRSSSLQLLLVAALAGWAGFHRFGPKQRDLTTERRSLQESATAVGNLYFRTDNGSAALRAYLEFLRQTMQQKFGSSFRIENSQDLARRVGWDEEEVHTVIKTARERVQNQSSSGECAKSIRELAALMNQLG